MKKHIQPGEKVPLELTASQRDLIIEKVLFLDDRYEALIREVPDGGPLMMTLDDYDDFCGYIAAEANHCDDKKLQKKLDVIFGKVQAVLENYTDEVQDGSLPSMPEARDKITSLMNAWMDSQNPFQLQSSSQTQSGLLKLTPLQRETLINHTELKSAIKRKLKKAEEGTQALEFSRDELNEIHDQTGIAAMYARSKEKQRLMAVQRKVVSIFEKDHAGLFEPPKSKARKRKAVALGSIFQFRIRLENIEPTIWRRIQVQDCTLDELHEHIQGSMGWENYHLHQFTINGVEFGPVDPHAMPFGPEFEDETAVLLSDVLPRTDSPVSFGYSYDFGDGWQHEVIFEGNPQTAKKQKYPICLEGERACPPEDVGGPWGFAEYLEALADPTNEQHADMLEWRGPFQAAEFSAEASTRRMQQLVRSGV